MRSGATPPGAANRLLSILTFLILWLAFEGVHAQTFEFDMPPPEAGMAFHEDLTDGTACEILGCDGGKGYSPYYKYTVVRYNPSADPETQQEVFRPYYEAGYRGKGICAPLNWVCPYTNDVASAVMEGDLYCPEGYSRNGAKCARYGIDPGKNSECPGGEDGCPLRGNPIHVVTGEKLQTEIDFSSTPGHLQLVRYYGSGSHWGKSALGWNWRHNFMRSLLVYGVLGEETVIAARPGGNQIIFLASSGTWEPESDVREGLAEEKSGSVRVGWTLTMPDNSVEHYDLTGQLNSVTYQSGDALTLSYSGGRLVDVADSAGRRLQLNYMQNLLTSVTLPDGASVQYNYTTSELVEQVEFRASTGTPTGSRQYLYEDPNSSNLLTGLMDEQQNRFASWSYDDTGLAITSAHGGVSSLIDRVSIDYSLSAPAVTDSLGKTANIGYIVDKGVVRITSVDEPCRDCGSTKTRSFDENGFPDVVVDFNDNVTDLDYDIQGREIQRKMGSTVGEPMHCPQGSNYYSNDYGSGCGSGSCWAVQPFPGSSDGTPLGYPGQYYSCPIPETVDQPPVRTIQTDWHASFNVPAERRTYDSADVLVAKSTWTYNTRGQALTQTYIDPVLGFSRTTTSTYCEQTDITAGTCPILGLVKSVNGPRTDVSDITTYIYRMTDAAGCATEPSTCLYRKGDVWKVTNAVGHVTETLKYDGAGRLLSIKDANAVVTDLEYHPRGWLTARKVRGTNVGSETDDAITRIEYWPTGLVKKVTQPDGAFTDFTYDAAHRLTDISDNEGNAIHYTLDNAGNRTNEDTMDDQGTLLRTLSRVYNQLGQLQTQQDAYQHATDYTYDANGNTDTVADALSQVTDNNYDPLNRLSRTLQDVAGIAAETKFEYDALDNLTKVTDPKGLDTDYSYNGFGDLMQLSSPDTGTTSYTYDSAGNRQTQTDARGITASYSYDALNRLIAIAYSDGSAGTTYTYDSGSNCNPYTKGRLARMADASGITLYCYDRFGNLTRKQQTVNGKIFTVQYAYTLAGQLSSVVYPDGLAVEYVRDAQGRTTEVGVTPSGGAREVLLREATYYPFGPPAEWTYGNGRLMRRSLNQNYQPGFIEDPFASGISLGYEFDAVGNLEKLRSADQSDPPQRTYDYDGLNHLTETRDGVSGTLLQDYAYDATGNRISASIAGTTTTYTYPASSHRLTQVGAITRIYDNAGNTRTIDGTAKTFAYNAANRMSQAKAGGVVMMNYVYNGKGEQVRKYRGTTNTYTVYDESGHWLGEYDNNGAPIQQAIWLDELPVGLVVGSGNQLHYIEPDHLGTPRVVIDPVRDVAVWNWDLAGEAFGNNAPDENPDGDANNFVFNMRFPGQRYDAASGLNYNYFRDYDPGTGRYIESDPVGLKGGITTYAYAGNSALLNLDRLGLKWVVGGTVPDGTNQMVIVCKGGKVTFINQGYDNLGCEELEVAALKHEMSHLSDIDPDVCSCAPDNSFVSNDDDALRLNSERKAFGIELEYLEVARSRAKTATCKRAIGSRIDDINNKHMPAVNAGTYGGP